MRHFCYVFTPLCATSTTVAAKVAQPSYRIAMVSGAAVVAAAKVSVLWTLIVRSFAFPPFRFSTIENCLSSVALEGSSD